MDLQDWPPGAQHALLKQFRINPKIPKKLTLKKFIKLSKKFPVKFPVEIPRCKFLKNHVSDEILMRNINSAYVIIHEHVLEFYCKFLLFKRKNGTEIEKKFYQKLNLKLFINRLLTRRPIVFVGTNDISLLRNGVTISGNKFELIGSSNEKKPLKLKNYLSYDEMKCSALLSVSSYTFFLNNGERYNNALLVEGKERENIQDEGVIVALVGPRLTKRNFMENQDVVINKFYDMRRELYVELYGEKPVNFDEIPIKGNDRFLYLNDGVYFDNLIYQKRIALNFDTFLIEANFRAKQVNKTAYLHVIGLGLGTWKISQHQDEIYMKTFGERLKFLGHNLHNISDVCFSYLKYDKCGDVKNGEIFPILNHPLGGIKIHIFNRQPHEKLQNEHQNKLLVVSYAWDGNAYPGNEFWTGHLTGSNDSSTASSTQVSELHNPLINKLIRADNAMIVTRNEGLIPLNKYVELINL